MLDPGFEEAADAEANPNSCIWRVVLALTAARQNLETPKGGGDPTPPPSPRVRAKATWVQALSTSLPCARSPSAALSWSVPQHSGPWPQVRVLQVERFFRPMS